MTDPQELQARAGAHRSPPRPGGRAPAAVAVLCAASLAAVVVVAVVRPSGTATAAAGASIAPTASASATASATTGAADAQSTTSPTTASPTATPTATTTATATSASGLSAADVLAGLTSRKVPQTGTGAYTVVAGEVAAPGSGTVKTVRVRVEKGLPINAKKFAVFVLKTLNDSRSWGHGGTMTFARTASSSADITVTLASPTTSAALCKPLITYGKLSCGMGSHANITLYRWTNAIPGYGTDLTGYRHYVINHEVGHTLGHVHKYCAGTGKLAPVMMQQTKGLKGCRPNPWPYP